MLRYLRPLLEPFSGRYRQYLPLATSTPRGDLSPQGSGPSSPSESTPPSSSIFPARLQILQKKASLPWRSLSWHIKFLILLSALAYTIHAAFQRSLPATSDSTEQARLEEIKLLKQQLSPSSQAPFYTTASSSPYSTHHVFHDISPGVASRQIRPIRAYDALSDPCIEQWVVHHVWGDACRGADLSAGLTIDAVWAWVNGSDPAQVLARNAYAPATKINVDAIHRYADHNELLYSMRSLLNSLGGAMGKMHVLGSAYPLPKQLIARGGEGKMMVGQVPYWLNTSEESKIEVHHDAQYFRPMQRASNKLSSADVDAWRAQTIPSFNSLAVESQMSNLPNPASDQLVYLNDDFFTLSPITITDLTSPLFGTVIKSDTSLFSFYRPSEHPFQRLWNPAGEEVGIKRAAWILGQRFSMRSLPYITHHPRSLSLPLLREAAQTFPEAFSNTTLARFRAQKEVPDSIQGFFLASWYVVERHREALLWSWVVAKWSGVERRVSERTKEGMWKELSEANDRGEVVKEDEIHVRRPVRKSRDEDTEAFLKAGVPTPKNTQYSFSSQDGHALSYLDWSWPWERTRNGYPDLSPDSAANKREHARSWIATDGEKQRKVCSISYSKCFAPKESETADTLFKRIAFSDAACGDCIIAALLRSSGASGISTFLPPPSATLRIAPDFTDVGSKAHLPLTSDWRASDFSLASIVPLHLQGRQLSLRTWCTRLIQRYQYVLGSTPSTFHKVEYASRLPKQLKAVDETLDEENPTTFVCLNDDIKEAQEGTSRLNGIMQDWFSLHWPDRIAGEITG